MIPDLARLVPVLTIAAAIVIGVALGVTGNWPIGGAVALVGVLFAKAEHRLFTGMGLSDDEAEGGR